MARVKIESSAKVTTGGAIGSINPHDSGFETKKYERKIPYTSFRTTISFFLIISNYFKRKQELEEGLSDNSAKWGTLAVLLGIFSNYAN